MEPQVLDMEKAIEVIVYLASKMAKLPNSDGNLIHVMKAIFFADKHHLERYGRLINGERYHRLPHGHMPTGAYDIFKYVRGDGFYWDAHPAEDAFSVGGDTIIPSPSRKPNFDRLSKSDLECLDIAVEMVKDLSFEELKELCAKEPSYDAVTTGSEIPLREIIKSLDNGKQLLEHLAA